MKIAIIGLGWAGKKMKNSLLNKGHEIYDVHHGSWLPQLCALFGSIKLDFVVNCSGFTGYPNVDACENDKNGVYNSNSIMPIQIWNYCQSKNIKYAHFSSGCIYEGRIDNIYADPNFFGSTYAISKGISDNFLKYRSLLFRIRMPFTNVHEPKNFLSKVYKYAKEGKLYEGGENSLTNLDEAVKVACDLIETNAFGPFNLVNNGSLTMHKIVDMMGLENVKWYDDTEFKSNVKCGRSNCIIPHFEKMSNIEESIYNCIQEWKISLSKECV